MCSWARGRGPDLSAAARYAAIGEWTSGRSVDEVLRVLDAAAVPAGRIYTMADIAADPHDAARGMLEQVRMDDGATIAVPGVVPKLSRTPGGHRRNAPRMGQDSEDVLRELGLTAGQIQARTAADCSSAARDDRGSRTCVLGPRPTLNDRPSV